MVRSMTMQGTEHDLKREQPQVRTREIEPRSSTDGDRPAKVYRPLIIRTPVILALLVSILCLIGLIEYACRSSPTEPFDGRSSPSANVVTLNVRNAAEPPSSHSSQQMKTTSISAITSFDIAQSTTPSTSGPSHTSGVLAAALVATSSSDAPITATSISSDTSSKKFTSHETAEESRSSDAYISASPIAPYEQIRGTKSPQVPPSTYLNTQVPTPVISAASPVLLSTEISDAFGPRGTDSSFASVVLSSEVTERASKISYIQASVTTQARPTPLTTPALTQNSQTHVSPSTQSMSNQPGDVISSAAVALSIDFLPQIITSASQQLSKQTLTDVSSARASVESYIQPTAKSDLQSNSLIGEYVPITTGLDDGIYSVGDGYLSAVLTSAQRGAAPLYSSVTARNYLKSSQLGGDSTDLPVSSVQSIGSQKNTRVSGKLVVPEASVALNAISRVAQKTNSRVAKPTAVNAASIISVRPGYVYTTTDSLGSTLLVVGSMTRYTTKISTDSKGNVHTDVLVQGTPTVIVNPDATGGLHTTTQLITATQTVSTSGQNRIDRSLHNLTVWTYFMASYLPILLAILLRISVGMIYAAVKMLEPFITLSKHSGRGVLAKDFLNINYLATNDHLDPIAALFTGHWSMLFTTILYGIAGFITPFASEFAGIYWFCNSNGVCGPEMRVKPTIGRTIEALLGITALMLLVFLFIERRYRSGVFADPSSIATMVALFHQPQVVKTFREANAKSSKREMQDVLARKRFSLDNYRHEDGSERYGLVYVQQDTLRSTTGLRDEYARLKDTRLWRTIFSPTYTQRRKRRNCYRLLREVFLGIATSGILIIVVWYYNNSDQNNGFEKFMDSDNFGPRFVFSVFGIILQAQWKRIERETCIIQPFRSLIASSSPASKSILIGRALDPLTSLLVALPRRHVYCALVALTSLLAEVLIVALSGVPFNSGQLQRAFCVSAYVAMGILSIMLLMQLALLLRRPRAPDLPRTPNTVGAVLSYLCGEGSRALREDFAQLATLGEKEKTERVKGWGRRYVLREGGSGEERRWEIVYDDDSGSNGGAGNV